jgi:hypothetical protein
MSTPDWVHDSLAEIPEEKLVGRIVTEPLWGREFFVFSGMPPGMVSRQCLSLTSAPGNPKGDIDVLFSSPDLPHQAVAYQLKRVKVGINQLRNGTPSKLQEFKQLAQQTNLISRMGFWQVYAHFIVVADEGEQNADNQSSGKLTFQGLSSKLQGLLYSAVSSAIPLFDGRIGIGVMEFIQTMDSEPFTVGTHGLQLRQRCEPASQSEELTKWVGDVFPRSPARKCDNKIANL